MRIATNVIVGFSLLLALPAGAQQAAPNAPASPSAGASQGSPPAGMMGGRGMKGEGRGGMGMMMGSSGVSSDDEDDADDDAGRTGRGHHRHEGRSTPMQIIINIGPDYRVETEEHGWGGRGGGSRSGMMGGERRGRMMADRVTAHLDYLHDQLQLTPEQQPAWDRFTSAVRDAVTHMRPGRAGMAQGQGLDQRLAAQEAMLNARLDAVQSVRAALSSLTSALNDAQKHTLDEVSAEFMPGRSMMQSHQP
jgi:LTXXQ motif family protein